MLTSCQMVTEEKFFYTENEAVTLLQIPPPCLGAVKIQGQLTHRSTPPPYRGDDADSPPEKICCLPFIQSHLSGQSFSGGPGWDGERERARLRKRTRHDTHRAAGKNPESLQIISPLDASALRWKSAFTTCQNDPCNLLCTVEHPPLAGDRGIAAGCKNFIVLTFREHVCIKVFGTQLQTNTSQVFSFI